MKKVLLSLLMLYSASLFAQHPLDFYIVYKNNGSSTMLAPNKLFNTGWDDTSATVALGFEMQFNGKYIDSVTINSNGYVVMEEVGVLYLFGIDFTDRVNLGSPFDSPVEYELDSIVDTNDPHFGSHIIRINWNGARFKGSVDTNYVNTTMILYEDNTIEYYYGASKVHSQLYLAGQLDTFPACAVCYQITPGIYNCLTAKGSVANPGWELQFGVSTPQYASPPWSPTGGLSGNRYTFEPLNLGIDQISATDMRMYPNPATNEITLVTDLSGKNFTIGIYDIAGRQIYTATSTSKELNIDISTLPKGFYTLKVATENAQAARKFIVE